MRQVITWFLAITWTTYLQLVEIRQIITIGVPNGSTGGYNWFGPGYQRGDNQQRDSYYRLNIVIARNITYKDYGRQRIKTKKSKVSGTKIR